MKRISIVESARDTIKLFKIYGKIREFPLEEFIEREEEILELLKKSNRIKQGNIEAIYRTVEIAKKLIEFRNFTLTLNFAHEKKFGKGEPLDLDELNKLFEDE